MSHDIDASIVIPTFNRRSSIERLLNSLATQTVPASSYEVVVSIDGSSDGTVELLQEYHAPYRLVYLWQSNRGRASACNAGLRESSGKVCILLDDDMEASPGLIAAHLQAHKRNGMLGVIGAAPARIPDEARPATKYVMNKFNAHLARLAQADHVMTLRDFYSGNFSAPTSLFDAHRFDETFVEYGNEDLEFAFRLRRAGIKIVYSAEAIAYQSNTKTFSELLRDNFGKGRTAVLLYQKHNAALSELKLSAFGSGSRVRRMLVRFAAPINNELTLRLLRSTAIKLERLGIIRSTRAYQATLDYFYWLGVLSASDNKPPVLVDVRA